MKYYLVKQEANYADEFDVNGFFTSKGESKKDILEELKPKYTEFPCEKYFGTNEAIEFEDLEEYLASFEIKEISEGEYKTLNKLFKGSFGETLILE